MTAPTVATKLNPDFVALDSTGQHAYVTNFNAGNAGTISQYTVDATGASTPSSTPTVAAVKGPSMLALDGSGRYA